jgi:hypothetical protein
VALINLISWRSLRASARGTQKQKNFSFGN